MREAGRRSSQDNEKRAPEFQHSQPHLRVRTTTVSGRHDHTTLTRSQDERCKLLTACHSVIHWALFLRLCQSTHACSSVRARISCTSCPATKPRSSKAMNNPY